MTTRSRWLILVFALLGLGFASASTWVHYKVLTDPSYVSPCDLNTTFSCSHVYLSRYGSVGGIPVAIAGMFWFGLVALIAAFAAPDNKASAAGSYLFGIATVGLAVVLYLGAASVFWLKTACLLCIGTYVSVIAIFVLAGSASSIPMTQIPTRLLNDVVAALRRPLVTMFALFLIAGTVTAAAYFPKEGTRPQPKATPPTQQGTQDFATVWAQQPRVDLGIPADGAKVVIVKFNDWQCPGCRQTHEWYKPILEKFEKSDPGMVKYVVKDWPWNKKCNFNTTTDMHTGSCEAAVAMRVAKEKGKQKEEEMEAWLFANQIPPATGEAVKEAAARILGISNFDEEYAKRLPDIRRDVADGGALRIGTTPTLFINGVRIEQIMPAQYFELAIQLELNKAGKK